MPPGLLNDSVTVDIGEETEAESIRGTGISESVHSEAGFSGIEDLPYTILHLVIVDRAPVGWLAVSDGLVFRRGGVV